MLRIPDRPPKMGTPGEGSSPMVGSIPGVQTPFEDRTRVDPPPSSATGWPLEEGFELGNITPDAAHAPPPIPPHPGFVHRARGALQPVAASRDEPGDARADRGSSAGAAESPGDLRI